MTSKLLLLFAPGEACLEILGSALALMASQVSHGLLHHYTFQMSAKLVKRAVAIAKPKGPSAHLSS